MNENHPPLPSFKRPAPPSVEPVTIGGMSYEQVKNALELGFDQMTGYLRAVDQESGEVAWVRKVYSISIDERMERDVQDVHFKSMQAGPDGLTLMIENERGEQYSVDTATGDSTRVE